MLTKLSSKPLKREFDYKGVPYVLTLTDKHISFRKKRTQKLKKSISIATLLSLMDVNAIQVPLFDPYDTEVLKT